MSFVSKFTQREVDDLIALPKSLTQEALEESEFRKRRKRTDERGRRVPLRHDMTDVSLDLEFDEAVNDERQEYQVSLVVEWPPRPRSAIFRFDIQRAAHGNPPWAGGQLILPFVPHFHIYSPIAVDRDEDEDSWQAIAEEIHMPVATFDTMKHRLFRIAMTAWNVTIEAPNTLFP